MNPARALLEATAFRAVLALTGILPRRVVLASAAPVAALARFCDRGHTRIARENLALALPDQPVDRRETILRDCWRHFARITLDSFACSRLDASALGSLVEYRGLEHIRAAYAKGRGVLLFSGHFGHWELTALMQGFLDLPLAMVTRPLDNAYLERVVARLRTRSGNRLIAKRAGVREMLRALREGLGVAIVIDQDARGQGVFVPFFGRPASTTTTLALLALRTGAAVVPTYSLPRPDGSYLVVWEPELPVAPTGDRDADVLRLTTAATAAIEHWVRRHPQLWLWMHRRWKTVPPDSRDTRPGFG